MKSALLAAICIVFFASTAAAAENPSQKETALKLLEVTNARKIADQMMNSVEAVMQQQLQAAGRDLPPEGREAMEIVRSENMKWLAENLSWDQMKDMYVDIYSKVFTEDEMNELITFYQSPLGQKLLAKTPELLQETMSRTQAMMQRKLPEFQDRLRKRLLELMAKYKK